MQRHEIKPSECFAFVITASKFIAVLSGFFNRNLKLNEMKKKRKFSLLFCQLSSLESFLMFHNYIT